MDENTKWNQAFGGGGGQQVQDQLNFLYNLAVTNPQNADIANTYLNAYMQYMSPAVNPYQGMGVDPQEYTTYMEGRGPNPQMIDIPPEEYEDYMKTQGVYPSGSIPTRQSLGERAIGLSQLYPGATQIGGALGGLRTGGFEGLKKYYSQLYNPQNISNLLGIGMR